LVKSLKKDIVLSRRQNVSFIQRKFLL